MREFIMMAPLDPVSMYFEIFFLILTTLSSFMIYFLTREIYQLTEHKGIKYFRMGFLFIGLANLGLLLNHLFMLRIISIGFNNERLLQEFFGLFNFIGIGYLFSSLYSKNIKEYYIYIITILVFFIGLFFRTRGLMFIYMSVLTIAIGIISFIKLKTEKKKKHFSQIYIIYILMFISWFLIILGRVFSDFDMRGRVYHEWITGTIFLYILYLVFKKLKWKSK